MSQVGTACACCQDISGFVVTHISTPPVGSGSGDSGASSQSLGSAVVRSHNAGVARKWLEPVTAGCGGSGAALT